MVRLKVMRTPFLIWPLDLSTRPRKLKTLPLLLNPRDSPIDWLLSLPSTPEPSFSSLVWVSPPFYTDSPNNLKPSKMLLTLNQERKECPSPPLSWAVLTLRTLLSLKRTSKNGSTRLSPSLVVPFTVRVWWSLLSPMVSMVSNISFLLSPRKTKMVQSKKVLSWT